MKKAPKITEIELNGELAGSEGVDGNHASQIRAQTLINQHASLIQQTQFADTKSAGLVTLVGLLALGGPIPVNQMMRSDFVSLLSGALSGLSILFCIFAVFPRYPGRRVRNNLSEIDRYSWPALTGKDFGPSEYAE